jgi:tetratricopeptide (TPR) repeat protein
LPDTLFVIVGRFPRNPALYYQMRIERVKEELASDPNRPDLYDDIAVACDRIGRSDEAIAWMLKKKQVLAQVAVFDSNKDALYRYYANIGTFYAHRWIRSGADRENMQDLEYARRAIAKAIEINPNAHFGREIFQLWAIEWLLSSDQEKTLGEWMETRADEAGIEIEKQIEGLRGLIVLGNAWESVDVFEAMSRALSSKHATLAHAANLRIAELRAAGKRPLKPETWENKRLPQPNVLYGSVLDHAAREYKRLREEAGEYQSKRTAFMMARLQQGRHPDTDPTFWQGWVEPPLPEVRSAPLLVRAQLYQGEIITVVVLVAVLFLAFLLGTWTLRSLVRLVTHGRTK